MVRHRCVGFRLEGLDDDLLDVVVAFVQLPDGEQRALSVFGILAHADEQPGRERDSEFARGFDDFEAELRFLARAVPMHGKLDGALEHQPHAGVVASQAA